MTCLSRRRVAVRCLLSLGALVLAGGVPAVTGEVLWQHDTGG